MGGLLQKIKTWWQTADRTQRAVSVLGSAFLVFLLAGTFYFASRPHMALAFSNLDSAEVGTVSDEITKLGIPVTYDVEGNVEVPADKVAEVRAKLAEAGKLPSAGHMGDDLSKFSPLDPPSVEQARMKEMLENQLAEAIENIKGIDKATVTLNLGEQSPFEQDTKPATGSVEVTLAPNAILAPDQGKVIAMLVANSVTGLTPDKVFVLDNSGHPLYDGTSNAADGGDESPKIAAEVAETNRRERDLQQALDATFGRGNTLVNVNLELDYDKTSIRKDIHPASDAVATMATSTENMSGPAAVAGGVNSINKAITPTLAGNSGSDRTYNNKVTQTEHPVDEDVTDTEVAPGGLKSMAISVLVNSAKVKSDEVQQFLNGYLKPYQADPKLAPYFAATVTGANFDTTAQDIAVQAEKSDQSRQRFEQILSFLPIGALLFVGFLVARAIGKAAKHSPLAALPDGGMMPLEPRGYGDTGSHEDGHGAGEEGAGMEEIIPIQEKLNLPLEQIKRMSEDKPENVAMLIKTWLLEEHK